MNTLEVKYIHEAKFPENIDDEERLIVDAMLKGYISDKELINYFDSFHGIKNFSIKYQMNRLYLKYDVQDRGQLLRKFISIFC